MCQAIPRRVLRVDADQRVEVDYDGERRWFEANGLADLAVGEYVVVYAGQVIERMDAADAEALLAFYNGLEDMLAEAAGG